MGFDVRPRELPVVDLQAIPDVEQLLTDNGMPGFEEFDDPRTFDRAIEQPEVEAPVAETCDHRELLPADAVLQHGGLALRSPRSCATSRTEPSLHAALDPGAIQTPHGLPRRADSPCNLDLAFSDREQPRTAPPTPLQLLHLNLSAR